MTDNRWAKPDDAGSGWPFDALSLKAEEYMFRVSGRAKGEDSVYTRCPACGAHPSEDGAGRHAAYCRDLRKMASSPHPPSSERPE